VVTKFHLLKYGLAAILTFVGAKMLLEHWIHIPILLSLAAVVVVLALSIIGSLVWPQARQQTVGKTGSMFGTTPHGGGPDSGSG
jgi:predicted tellurium resistance membrane protein TerC